MAVWSVPWARDHKSLYQQDINSGQLNPAIPAYDYEPYRRLKQETIGAAAGRASQAARGTAAAMEGRGLSGIPGVQSDITQRYNTALQGQVGQQMASIDSQASQQKMQYDQWRSGFESQIAQYNQALKQGKIDRWIEGISTLIGAGMKIAGAGMGGGAGAGMSAAGGGVAGAGSAASSLQVPQFNPASFAQLPTVGLGFNRSRRPDEYMYQNTLGY